MAPSYLEGGASGKPGALHPSEKGQPKWLTHSQMRCYQHNRFMRDLVREHLAKSEARTVRSPDCTEILNDICLFAHFDGNHQVDPYVLFYLRALYDAGFSTIFITPCAISAEDEERVRKFCCDVIRRTNSGLDFGSWSDAFQLYSGRFKGRLLLANDSVYGPMSDLKELLSRLTAEKADFYGLVECNKIAPHLQSWFLLFEPHVVTSSAFHEILNQDFGQMSKIDVVKNGEVGLTQKLNAVGFQYRALVAFPNEHPLGKIGFNPMHILWREIMEYELLPFLKIEVLRDRVSILQRNLGLQNISKEWRDLIEQHLNCRFNKNKNNKSYLFSVLLYFYSRSIIFIYNYYRDKIHR